MKRKNLMPFNLQFFAEGGTSEGGDATLDTPTASQGEQEIEKTPTIEELLSQIAEKDAAYKKLKAANDATSKSEAELKRQLRAKQTIQEQEDEAKKEADAAKDARIKELEEKMAVIDNTSFWGGASIGMDEALAKSTAEAEALGDKEKFRANIMKHIKAIKENAIQQALKDRPDISAGNGDTDKNAAAKEAAQAAAKRAGTANQDILNHYRRK